MTSGEIIQAHAAAVVAFDALVAAQTTLVALTEALDRVSVRDLLTDPEWAAIAALDGLRSDLATDAQVFNPVLARLSRMRRLTVPDVPESDESPTV